MPPSSLATEGCRTTGDTCATGPRLTIRLATPDLGVVAIDEALASSLGRLSAQLVGHSARELFHPREWAGVVQRLEDVMLLGSDAFGAVALRADGGASVWVDIQARYSYTGQQLLELDCQLLEHPAAGRLDEAAAAALERPAGLESGGLAAGAMAAGGAGPALLASATTVAIAMRRSAPEGRAPPGQPASSVRPPPQTTHEPAALRASSGGSQLGASASASLPGPALALVMTALDCAGVAALALAADGTVVSASVACEALFGVPVARLRGQELVSLLALPPDQAALFTRARRERRRHVLEVEQLAGQGPVAVVWLPETTPGAGYALLLTALPLVAQGEAERVQTRLVSFVAHDVREVLANLYCGLRLLSEDLPIDAPQRPTVDRLLGDSGRACRIVDDVLAVSRPGRLSCVPLELAAVVHETLERYRPRAASAGIEVRETLALGLYVNADLAGLERAFGNLFENAIEATPYAGTLEVACEADDRGRPGVRVSIADSGMGIPPAIQPNLFEPFVSGKSRGTGLGLASVRRIVTDHEGTIDFETKVGCGTTFHIWLPRIDPPLGSDDAKEDS